MVEDIDVDELRRSGHSEEFIALCVKHNKIRTGIEMGISDFWLGVIACLGAEVLIGLILYGIGMWMMSGFQNG